MEFSEVIGLVVSICSVFITVLIVMQRGRNAMLEGNLATMWKRIDENKCKIDETEKHIDRNFHSKDEVREYISLINAPYLKQMEHINGKLDDLQGMVKELVERNIGHAG